MVRFIIVVSNTHLRKLESGSELCRPRTALYVKLHETCAMFYATGDSNPLHGDLVISSYIPWQNPSRSRVLDVFLVSRHGGAVAVGHVYAERSERSFGASFLS